MSRKTRIGVIAVTALGVLGTAFVTVLARRETPKTTMQDLNSSEQLKRRLQEDAQKVILVALISPVCPLCRHGFADIQNVLKSIHDERLRAHIVFLPMFPGDNKDRALTRTKEFDDPRVSYYWDADRVTGSEWQKVLGIDRTAWDVYLLYGRNTDWNGSTPKPAFWMHQLEGITKAPCLNKAELGDKVRELLDSLKS